jgi:hypothetical protein
LANESLKRRDQDGERTRVQAGNDGRMSAETKMGASVVRTCLPEQSGAWFGNTEEGEAVLSGVQWLLPVPCPTPWGSEMGRLAH